VALNTLLSVHVQPGAIGRYVMAISRLADAARRKKEPFTWGAFETLYGEDGPIRFVSSAETFAALAKRGSVPELAARVLGAAEAQKLVEEVSSCVASQSTTITVDRPDLSYVRSPLKPGELKAASVTRARVRAGGRESYEELMRKLAAAIPKLDDPSQLIVRQTLVGNVAEYVAIRPLRDLAELDAHRTPEQLLTQAFGPAEGGMIFRNGGAAIEQLDRSIVGYRADLSNPAA
jgi:hypothetical protein